MSNIFGSIVVFSSCRQPRMHQLSLSSALESYTPLIMYVNVPDSLVCAFERLMVRVSPLAIADSVELEASPRHTNAGAKSARARAPFFGLEAWRNTGASTLIPSARPNQRDRRPAQPRFRAP